jgi:hypothetical protein
MAAYIAIRSGDAVQPKADEYAVLVFASAALSAAGGAGFARIGRADPRHARSAVRRLITAGRTVRLARQTLEADRDDMLHIRSATDLLATVEAQLRDGIRDWNDVHSEALREVVSREESETQDLLADEPVDEGPWDQLPAEEEEA